MPPSHERLASLFPILRTVKSSLLLARESPKLSASIRMKGKDLVTNFMRRDQG